MRFLHAISFTLVALGMVACGGKENKEQPAPVYESERASANQEVTAADKLKIGEDIFNGKGMCNTCHLADKKVIGPSIQEIMKVYSKDGADIISFLKGNEEPIVDPSQFIIMQANIAITKKMTDLELESLVLYMESL